MKLTSKATGGVNNRSTPARSAMGEPQPGRSTIISANASHGTNDIKKPVLPTAIAYAS
jgi:hypothetical protein